MSSPFSFLQVSNRAGPLHIMARALDSTYTTCRGPLRALHVRKLDRVVTVTGTRVLKYCVAECADVLFVSLLLDEKRIALIEAWITCLG